MTPSESPVIISHPKFGEIKSAKDVFKNREALANGPAGIQISAAWLLLSDDWIETLLPQFVTECVADSEPKATHKLDHTLSFVLNALSARVKEMKEEEDEAECMVSKHRNN